jgi:serine protease Do
VGIGFAIPINMAKSVMHQLVAHGKVTRGYLGLLPQDIDDNLARAMNLKDTKGALVGDVTPGGPAEKAGVKRGDVIREFNGAEVDNSTHLRNLVAEAEPGSTAHLKVLRDGKTLDLSVSLGERPHDLAQGSRGEAAPEEKTDKKVGLSVENLTQDIAKALGYQGDQGVVVTSVRAGSIAEEAGLQKNDLIKEVNRAKVGSVDEFERAMEKAGHGGSLALLVRRGQNTFFVALSASS